MNPTPLRTRVYIDGFNLYYGLVRQTPYKWLDLRAMCQAYLDPAKNQIDRIKYFTARIVPRPSDREQGVRQETYLRALQTFPGIDIIYGHFLSHKVRMPRADGAGTIEVIKTEEKKSDVNLAVHMLHDAFQNRYDLAVIVSNDSDFSDVLAIIKNELNKKIGILNPQRRASRELQKHALFFKQLRQSVAARCQLPLQLQDAHGIIRKPGAWN